MQCIHCTTVADESQERLEICESTKDLKNILDLIKEWAHMIMWRKISNKLNTLYREAKLNKCTESDQHSAATRFKAALGVRSFWLEQVPEGNILKSPDESEDSCDFILEGSTQATDASSAPNECQCVCSPRWSTVTKCSLVAFSFLHYKKENVDKQFEKECEL